MGDLGARVAAGVCALLLGFWRGRAGLRAGERGED